MVAYKLTHKAQHDLLSIGRYTLKGWGVAQRNFYLKQLDACFSQIAESPMLGMACDFIVAGYRKLPQGSHVIFYKKDSAGVVYHQAKHDAASGIRILAIIRNTGEPIWQNSMNRY